VQDLPFIDERKYMQDVVALGGFEPHFIRADELSPMRDVERVHQQLDEATCAPNLYLHWAMYETASRAGVRVFLDGFDGDTTLSYGYDYLRDLALSLRWKTLRQEARLLAWNLRCPAKTIIQEHCLKPLVPEWLSRLWRKAHGRPADPQAMETFLARQFKERMGFGKRVRSLTRTPKRFHLSTARENHLEGLEHPAYPYALELTDKASAAFQVEARYPFFDRRLVELALSLPAGQKLGQGWSRLILRRAMTSYLPESIQWRSSKGNLSPNFERKLLERDGTVVEDVILHHTSELEPYVDLVSIRKAYETYKVTPLWHRGSFNIFAAVNLAIWLRTADVRL
jgi:asparagine synthase (glutamine-hydrolysing)